MEHLEADLDDVTPGVRDATGGQRRRLLWSVVLGAAALLVGGVLTVPRLFPDEPPPRLVVDDVSVGSRDGGQPIDLHLDADGRPVGAVTVRLGLDVRAVTVPPGVREVGVRGLQGPGLAPAPAGTAFDVGIVPGEPRSGAVEIQVACDAVPDGVRSADYAVVVGYVRATGRATTTAAPPATLSALLDRVCAARTLRGDVTVVGVEALPGRSGLRVTVENRGRRTVWLRSVVDRGASGDPAGPGRSEHDIPLGRTSCALLSVLLSGGSVTSDGTTRAAPSQGGSLRLGVMGALSQDATGPDGAVMPVGLSTAAEDDADRAMKRLCGA